MQAGFKEIRIQYIGDSFVLKGESEESALVNTISHIVNLFGLEALRPLRNCPEAWLAVMERLKRYFTIPEWIPFRDRFARQITVRKVAGGYEAEFPRVALVATGVKS